MGAAKVAFGVENDGVLVRLKASPTNCNLIFPSLKLKVRETFWSMLKKPGPRRRFLPVVPRVPAGGIGERGPVEVRSVGVVSAQDLDYRIDLARRLSLAAGIHGAAGADGERQTAEPAERAADLEAADDLAQARRG